MRFCISPNRICFTATEVHLPSVKTFTDFKGKHFSGAFYFFSTEALEKLLGVKGPQGELSLF